jgi:hypothetical protein
MQELQRFYLDHDEDRQIGRLSRVGHRQASATAQSSEQ